MPDFTLYNASDFNPDTPKEAREDFTESLGAPRAVSGEGSGEARYYSREDIFDACLNVSANGDAAFIALGGTSNSAGLVFARLHPTDVCLLGTEDFLRSLHYRLCASGDWFGSVAQTAPYDYLNLHTLYKAEVSMHEYTGTFRITEYAYVDNGTAYRPNGEECITPLDDGSYVLLERTSPIS